MDHVIKVNFPDGQRIEADVQGKVIKSDRPVDMGGEGTEPTPFALFLTSIATCAGMYALGFCQSRDLSTEGMVLTLVSEKKDQVDLKNRIIIKLKLPDGFPEKYKRPILRTMDQCSVKQFILNPPEFFMETE